MRRTDIGGGTRTMATTELGYRESGRLTARNPPHTIVASREKERSYFRRQHFLYFLPLPQGHGSLRPALIVFASVRVDWPRTTVP